MQEIIILNDKAGIRACELAIKENKPVLVCYPFSEYGLFIQPNLVMEYPYKLSRVVMIHRGNGFSGSQYVLTNKNMPKERGIGYVLQ